MLTSKRRWWDHRGMQEPVLDQLWGAQQSVADAWLAECNSPNTRLAYCCDVDMFGRWCVQRGSIPLPVDTSTVLAFEAARRAAGDSPATLRRRRSALSSFFDFATEAD